MKKTWRYLYLLQGLSLLLLALWAYTPAYAETLLEESYSKTYRTDDYINSVAKKMGSVFTASNNESVTKIKMWGYLRGSARTLKYEIVEYSGTWNDATPVCSVTSSTAYYPSSSMPPQALELTVSGCNLTSGTQYVVYAQVTNGDGTDGAGYAYLDDYANGSNQGAMYNGSYVSPPDWYTSPFELYGEITETPATPDSGGLNYIFSIATTTFYQTTGVNYEDILAWDSDLIKLTIGSGLGFLSAIMPWLIAILVFMTALFLIVRGFRFFRH